MTPKKCFTTIFQLMNHSGTFLKLGRFREIIFAHGHVEPPLMRTRNSVSQSSSIPMPLPDARSLQTEQLYQARRHDGARQWPRVVQKGYSNGYRMTANSIASIKSFVNADANTNDDTEPLMINSTFLETPEYSCRHVTRMYLFAVQGFDSPDGKTWCVECESKLATRFCNGCEEPFCDEFVPRSHPNDAAPCYDITRPLPTQTRWTQLLRKDSQKRKAQRSHIHAP